MERSHVMDLVIRAGKEGIFSMMQETNGGTSHLVRGRTPRAFSSISTERRLLGWAVTLAGAALMAAGGTLVFMSIP
jgi:hypothetical protein